MQATPWSTGPPLPLLVCAVGGRGGDKGQRDGLMGECASVGMASVGHRVVKMRKMS